MLALNIIGENYHSTKIDGLTSFFDPQRFQTVDLAGPDGIGAVGGLEDQAGVDTGETARVHLEAS